jgi:hypothetical protein
LYGALKHFKIKTEGLVDNFFHPAVEEEVDKQGEERTVAIDLPPKKVLNRVNLQIWIMMKLC